LLASSRRNPFHYLRSAWLRTLPPRLNLKPHQAATGVPSGAFFAASESSAALTARSKSGTGSTTSVALPAPRLQASSSGVRTMAWLRVRLAGLALRGVPRGLAHWQRADPLDRVAEHAHG